MKLLKRLWQRTAANTEATFSRLIKTGLGPASRQPAAPADPVRRLGAPDDDEPHDQPQPTREVISQVRPHTPSPAAEQARPAGWIEPADLPTTAPTIGRMGTATLGVFGVDCSWRPSAIAVDGTTAGSFHVAAASIIGAGHLQSGQPRQDAYNLMLGRSGSLYVAIADGLGSRPTSQLGAHLFTESVLIAAAESESKAGFPVTAAQLLAQASARTARMLTEAYRLEIKDAACVGAVAIFSAQLCDVARIGDVAAFTLADGEFAEAFPVDSGFVNVVTATLPGEEAPQVDTTELGPAEIVVLGTDGLANDLRNSPALRTWLAARWRVPQWPFAMGDTLRYRRQGSHDDRTAIVVWRTTAPSPADRQNPPAALAEVDDGTG